MSFLFIPSSSARERGKNFRCGALEACKQCGHDRLPEISEPLAPGGRSFREVLRENPGTEASTFLVGPEGDFTPEEISSAIHAGFVPVSLGSIILRVETATLFGISALRYEFGEL